MKYILGIAVLVGVIYAAAKTLFRNVFLSLIVNGTEIVTASVPLDTIIEAGKSGNKVAVKDESGLKVTTWIDSGNFYVGIMIDLGIDGIRLTKSWEVNCGSIRLIMGAGSTFRLLDSPVTVDLNLRVG
jgi:hypothetical protein